MMLEMNSATEDRNAGTRSRRGEPMALKWIRGCSRGQVSVHILSLATTAARLIGFPDVVPGDLSIGQRLSQIDHPIKALCHVVLASIEHILGIPMLPTLSLITQL